MRKNRPVAFLQRSASPRTGTITRARRCAAVLVMAAAVTMVAMQVACTDIVKFSPAAAMATFAPTDVPFAFTRDADFGTFQPSADARELANAIVHAGDHAGANFIIVDKRDAMLYVFGNDGALRGATAVLLGSARGDNSVPDIGLRPMDQVRPAERTTPAGRFIGERGVNTLGEDIVWVDYDAAVSMHRVRAVNAKERRLERLATPSADDNRISYGCINIPAVFFDNQIAPLFTAQRAVVYILPEVKPLHEVFSFYAFPKRN